MARSTSLERGLPDVKAIATLAERTRPKLPRPTAREIAAERRRYIEDERLLRKAFDKFVDVAALERLARKREKSDAKRAEAAHRRAIAASRQYARWVASQSVSTTAVAPIDGDRQVIVDTAAWMRAWPNTGALKDYDTSAGNNWGKYWLDVEGDILEPPDEARLSFYALWQNPADVDVTVRVATRLNVSAHIHADADARYFSGLPGASADATLRARLTVFPLWLQNNQLTVAEDFVGSVSAHGGFFGDDDDATIFSSAFLDGTLSLSVPGNRFLMFETSLVTGWKIDSGSIRVDAQQGAFRIDVPYWIVTMVT